MNLTAGSRLGPYEVQTPLGAGGMGEVYRARDTRLARTIVLKVLAPELASDPAFKARFEREAQTISALNHPHICTIHDVGHHDGIDYLVLEYLEGETLATRLERGALPLAETLQYAIAIAGALDAAHRHGIVHRDLKPGNVMLTASGAKLLDFGLAKQPTGSAAATFSSMATEAAAATAQGTIVGTLPYMAPEQLEGRDVDVRTDIFAFGAVLYEMCTGRRAFQADSQVSLVGKILESVPPPSSSIAPVPAALDHVIETCLAKRPGDRWQSAHDLLLQLRWIQQDASRPELAAPVTLRRPREWSAWAAALIAAAAAIAGWNRYFTRETNDRPVVLTDINLPANVIIDDYRGGPAISPDGRMVVVAALVDGNAVLALRRLDERTFAPLQGTSGGRAPFWSPDSRSIGFWANGKLIRLDLSEGTPAVITDMPIPGSASWSPDDVILLSTTNAGPLSRVSANGGTPSQVTALDASRGDLQHLLPHFLPDGRSFLFAVRGRTPGIYAASLDSPETTRILPGTSRASYVEAGFVLFARGSSIMAVRFDPQRRQASGSPIPLISDVRHGLFSTSTTGNVVYRIAERSTTQLRWYSRAGKRLQEVGPPGNYLQIALSPSGRQVAIQAGDPGFHNIGAATLWLMDLARGALSRLTSDQTTDADPSWLPDERSIAFATARGDRSKIYRKDLMTGAEEPFVDIGKSVVLDEITPDGRYAIVRSYGRAIFAVPLSGDRKPRTLVDTPLIVEDQAHVSPDGRWIAFNADEAATEEVFVATFPDFTQKRQISNGGGVQPLWRRDSRELFYLTPEGTLMSVSVGTGRPLQAGVPQVLFKATLKPDGGLSEYAVSPDGQRFLFVEPTTRRSHEIGLLLNWRPPAARQD